jgi:exodeoxyribonuclease-1
LIGAVFFGFLCEQLGIFMANSLYWYDYETFGLDPSRDGISQFAGIRTNERLEVIGEPLTIYCYPPIDRLPSPEACLVTGITPQIALEKGIPEKEFIQKVLQELSFPNTCGVGYNSIGFDDEFTRYTLYRNFYDPYSREWENGNSRWDILNLLRLSRALRPDGIEWPVKNDGSPCFKLTSLTQANGIDHESAHDALSDVLATINVAKLVMTNQPKLYDYVYQLRFKDKVMELIDVRQRKPFLHVSGKLPKENYYTTLMLSLARHPTNKNSIICFNLMGDLEPLLELSVKEIYQRLFFRKSDQEKLSVLTIEVNKCPVVATAKLIDSLVAKRLGISLEQCESNLQLLLKNNLASKLQAVYAMRVFENSDDPERSLYQGFIDNSDKKLLPIAREASPQELTASSILFRDKRYQELIFLYRAKNYPDSLSLQEQTVWKNMRLKRLTDIVGGQLSLESYFSRIDELLSAEKLSEQDCNILLSLKDWGRDILGELHVK